jgi:hypothetical protein
VVDVLANVWFLLIGIVFIMLGNGMHFTLIGLRGGVEGFCISGIYVTAESWLNNASTNETRGKVLSA